MPTCDGLDTPKIATLSTALVGTSLAAPAAEPDCDEEYCEIAKAGGQVCPAELCGRSGTWRPKAHCPPLIPHRSGRAEPQAAALGARAGGGTPGGNPDDVVKKRRQAVARIRPKLGALIREMNAALDDGVLAADEDVLLAILERWARELEKVPPPTRAAKRRKPRRPPRRKRR